MMCIIVIVLLFIDDDGMKEVQDRSQSILITSAAFDRLLHKSKARSYLTCHAGIGGKSACMSE